MGEPLTLALALQADRNPDERGAINFIFAIFIAVALAFLFTTVVPLLQDSTTSETEVIFALYPSDQRVLRLGSNGAPMLSPEEGGDKLRATVTRLEKQVYGDIKGEFCAGVYKYNGSSLETTAIPFKDAYGRPCTDPLSSVQTKVSAQAAALGATQVEKHPFFVVFYAKNKDLATVQPALTMNDRASVAVATVLPQNVEVGGETPPTATPVPAATNTPPPPPPTNTPVATPTPVVEPTNTPSLGSTGGNQDTNPSVSETNQNQPANSGRAVDAYSF